MCGKQSNETAGMDIDAEELPPRWSTIACGHFKVRPISAAHLFGGRGGKLPHAHMPRLVRYLVYIFARKHDSAMLWLLVGGRCGQLPHADMP